MSDKEKAILQWYEDAGINLTQSQRNVITALGAMPTGSGYTFLLRTLGHFNNLYPEPLLYLKCKKLIKREEN